MKEKLLCPAGAWGAALSVALTILVIGCAPRTVRVEIPPRIDLRSHNAIGVLDFTSGPADKLGRVATQQFMSAIQEAQPGVRFLELGPMNRLPQLAGRERLDPDTLRIVARHYNVDSVFTGTCEVSDLQPQVRIDKDLSSVRASAKVGMSLTAKLWDTKNGTTIWTSTRHGEWPVARVRMEGGQPVDVSVSDPRDRYGEFMGQLVNAVTSDFRVRYERRPVAGQ